MTLEECIIADLERTKAHIDFIIYVLQKMTPDKYEINELNNVFNVVSTLKMDRVIFNAWQQLNNNKRMDDE